MGKTSSVICRVIKIGMEGKGQYILIDCNNRVLCKIDATKKKVYKPNCEIKWDDKKKQECDDGNDNENENWEEIKWEFTSLLDDKTEDSAEKSSGNVDNQVGDWKLRIKQKQKDEYKNINIPSCKHTKSKESFYEEIDTHIKQLLYIINGTTEAKRYQNLWKNSTEVVLEKIFVDKEKKVEESSVIFRVIKIDNEGKDEYVLTNCENKVLCKIDDEKEVYIPNSKCEIKWDDKEETREQVCKNKKWRKVELIQSFLTKKTTQYAIKRKESRGDANNQYRVWKLGIKQEQQGEYQYKNIASCKHTELQGSKSFNKEINTHIKQLLYIINGTSQSQATTYQQLWEGAVEVVFEEIFVDEYIKTINEAENEINPYLKSLIAPEENQKPQERFLKDIFDKLRAQYVEGRLAGEHGMKDGGIWNAGSTGIDGEVYKYYAEKQKGDTHE